jgi:hypothetical protein
MPRGSCKSQSSEECSSSIIRVTIIDELGTTLAVTSNRCMLHRNLILFFHSMHKLLVTTNVVPSSPILVTLMMEAIRSSETSARATWRAEDGILHSHCRENLKSYRKILTFVIFYVTRILIVIITRSQHWAQNGD